ncbi:hypothetical protein [Nocardia farcinica]|uniref:hypothetical protein n=1 Tax=Nocardia farcinica TaxID=37329 RepID=UPI0018959EA3|nr:hypothetical protein [Nocardia farcinica]MBF6306959.1 hypothetical protein [Nocardia farcinica]MBF6504311.1 hypothetical protein [Nocardia farcinica]MBF6519683.1 hypothetical protein [Nocardia farcinica]
MHDRHADRPGAGAVQLAVELRDQLLRSGIHAGIDQRILTLRDVSGEQTRDGARPLPAGVDADQPPIANCFH